MSRHDADHGAAKTYPAPGQHSTSGPSAARPGWQVVEDIHLPQPTYWPAVLALGITFLAWGILTSPIIIVVGLLLFAVGLGGWIGDLQHEQH